MFVQKCEKSTACFLGGFLGFFAFLSAYLQLV